MGISAHNIANPRKQRIKTPHLVIIEFVLDQLPHVGTAGELLYLSLTPNYQATPAKLYHELIFFNISDGKELGKHIKHMARVAKKLQKR